MRKEFNNWVSSHKKELIIGGVVVAVIITGSIILYIHPEIIDAITSLPEKKSSESGVKLLSRSAQSLSEKTVEAADICTTTKTISFADTPPFNVREHVRALPKGKHASEAAKAYAEELGITLQSDQTIVKPYMKCKATV